MAKCLQKAKSGNNDIVEVVLCKNKCQDLPKVEAICDHEQEEIHNKEGT